uniref:Uncharacterized protein n=1 Tax=Micrurus lemniscatus lemniscatus TaxID=129467 RepID=A0A2D4IUD8_MICLE
MSSGHKGKMEYLQDRPCCFSYSPFSIPPTVNKANFLTWRCLQEQSCCCDVASSPQSCMHHTPPPGYLSCKGNKLMLEPDRTSQLPGISTAQQHPVRRRLAGLQLSSLSILITAWRSGKTTIEL